MDKYEDMFGNNCEKKHLIICQAGWWSGGHLVVAVDRDLPHTLRYSAVGVCEMELGCRIKIPSTPGPVSPDLIKML